MLALAVVTLPFFQVAFEGKTFSADGFVPGVNGFDPVPGTPKVPLEQRWIDPGASAWQFEPWAEVVGRMLHQGDVPLWNPWQALGTPLAAAMQPGVFDPLLAPVRIWPSQLAWDLSLIASILLGAAAAYGYARLLGLSWPACLTAAAGFLLSGFFLTYTNNHFFRSYLYLPVLLSAVELLLRSRRAMPVALLALAVAGNLVVGMPEASFFVLSATGAYALFRILVGPLESSRWNVVLRITGGVIMGVALASPLLFAFLEFVTRSFNIHAAERPGVRIDSPWTPLVWALPHVQDVVRNWNGVAVFALAVVAVFSIGRNRRRVAWFFLALVGLLTLKIVGSPLVQWIGRLPLAELVIFPVFALPVVSFGLVMLAAIGVQAVIDGATNRRPWLHASAVALLLASVLALAAVAAPAGKRRGEPAVPIRAALPAVAGSSLVIAGLLVRRGRAGGLLVASGVIVELLLLAPRGGYLDRYDPYHPPAWLERLRQDAAIHPNGRMYGYDGKLYPNTAGVFGLYDIRSLDALYVDRYMAYMRAFVEPEVRDRFTGVPADQWTPPHVRDNPMFDLLGVRYLVTSGTRPWSRVIEEIFERRESNPAFRPAVFDIRGDRRHVLFLHSTQEVAYPVETMQLARVRFGYAVDPSAWSDPTADGVALSLSAVGGDGKRRQVWEGEYVPRSDPVLPEWREAEIDLSRLSGPITSLVFRTDARGNGAHDWAGWAEIQLLDAGGKPISDDGLREVARFHDAAVFGWDRALPRAFLVGRVQPARDLDDALELFRARGRRFPDGWVQVTEFDPRREAVVERSRELPAALVTGQGGGDPPGTARILAYSSNRVVIETDAARPGLLVLTDTYYPGWVASVKGREAPVVPTNVLFRGVPVPAGRSLVVLKYQPGPFRVGTVLATISLLALLAFVLGDMVVHRRQTSLDRVPYAGRRG
ncbi:MAG: YfhO family protein [Actinomycetota bacterium]